MNNDLFSHFFEWDCWFCLHCDKGIPNDRRDMLRHLLEEHKIEVKEE